MLPGRIITSPATGMTLMQINAGRFQMGSNPQAERERNIDEQQHLVLIPRPFWIGRHEVTVGQFKVFVNETNFKTDAEKNGEGSSGFIRPGEWKKDPLINWLNPGFEQTDDHPVVCVSWNDATAFCEWLSTKEARLYRLPTEAEWEYCCRAANSRARYFSGNDVKALDRQGWYEGNSQNRSHPVGQKQPNNWNLYDMHGNAWEWCADRYAPQFAKENDDPQGPATGELRVHRGGSWRALDRNCRTAVRGKGVPSLSNASLGFRVVQSPERVVTNRIGMKLALMPTGTFTMGSPGNELWRNNDEEQPHEVAITRPFYLGVYKVTVGQFKSFVQETDYKTDAEKSPQGAFRLFPDGKWKNDETANWRNPGFEQTDEHPVVCVSWNDALAFCAWLSKKEGRHCTLPTEAQWEFACRAGNQSRFFFGQAQNRLDQYAWFKQNAEKATHPVGLKDPNKLGLFDMLGNACEMVIDWYAHRLL